MSNTLFFKSFISQLADRAKIKINGDKPWDITVHDESFYERVFRKGSLGFGESYVEGLWDCKQLDELMARIIAADYSDLMRFNFKKALFLAKAKFFNRQSVRMSKTVAKKHYDIGNDLFEKMLDSRMMYSCAYWKDADNLEEAQEAKLDLICRKLKLKAGEKVLDIGCGWGGFAKYAAEKYGVSVVGITISKEQETRAKERCENLPVEIKIQDYREVTGEFDKIVSIGMFEHVGYKNYETYMNVVHRVLRKDGLFLLHCIGSNQSVTVSDAWFDKYVFPNGMMPSISQIGKAVENKFNLEDWHNMGLHYDPTLMEWLKRFKESWTTLQNSYDPSFYRMWIYYLATSAASFRVKSNNLWQIVFSKIGNRICYESVR